MAVEARLTELANRLSQVSGSNLVSLVLYGGLARHEYRPGGSDVNLLIVLNEAGPEDLEALRPTMREAWRSLRVDPLVLAERGLEAFAEAFPTKFLDIREHHRVLAGRDLLGGIDVPARRQWLRLEQSLRNLGLRLRRAFLTGPSRPQERLALLHRFAVPLTVEMKAMRRLAEDQDIESDEEALQALQDLHSGRHVSLDGDQLFRRVLDMTFRAAEAARREGETGEPP